MISEGVYLDSFDDNEGPLRTGARTAERDGARDTLRLEPAEGRSPARGRTGAAGPDETEGSEGDAEARMRQALGLFGQRGSGHSVPVEHGGSDRRQAGGGHMQVGARRHRFVQDGEVQVSVVRGRRDQSTTNPAPAMRTADEQGAERAGREQAERRLAEAQTTIRTLQTRLGHAELERDEALGEARALRDQLQTERSAAEEQARRLAVAEARRERVQLRAAEREDDPRAGETPGVEPEPVKWWL